MRASGFDVRPRPFSTRFWVALVICAAVIVGLLGMHTLSSRGAGHDAPSSTALHPAAAQEAPASRDVDEHPCDCQPVAPAPAPEHSMLLMACVLALLATLLVLHGPQLGGVLRATRRVGGRDVERARGTLARPRPPSLLVLSISRT
ncbi:DUF6153 family protein [Agrococcus sp. HG114]|uniref:DUF6153 family protein n=1 Tax=Agrococcus sp. HG114 TaxID=2969757 RepID=UPI00215A5BD6|nr:DUF6153 family protein [Agrococcus sp. HG114]MCR8670233.1 DUF6153 family protein [Agrococcus sp. HG114]